LNSGVNPGITSGHCAGWAGVRVIIRDASNVGVMVGVVVTEGEGLGVFDGRFVAVGENVDGGVTGGTTVTVSIYVALAV